MNEQWKQKIESMVKSNDIVAFIRGTREAPRCGFTAKVVRVLGELNHPYVTEDMDSDPELWQTLRELNNWRTSPQIYVKGEFVGGCDIVVEMFKNGELQTMLTK